ncbi:DUF3662 and FHA domain-containing protein [Corynebacterium freiburgense]|uniref:DUF3662 and FHA domain-containing protein n=1 Tax=Corynebacterium freiburgense TaxID=556548 RepID=UPI0004240781|nr:DUF3662 and FHA domain-containing protein [Corynebacterium freiburgense]WJZ01341.1 FHA domain-containing protein FhaA [Corynebacterium freiburgense]
MSVMGRIAKLDSALQRGLDNGFAFVFGGKVVPAELEELLKQEAEDNIAQANGGGILSPNLFEVSVSTKDFLNLSSNHPSLPADFADRMGRFARNKGWSLAGPVVVFVMLDGGLRTGQLKARSTSNPNPGFSSGFAGQDSDQGPVSYGSQYEPQPYADSGTSHTGTPSNGSGGYQPQPETFLQPAQHPNQQPMHQPSMDSSSYSQEPPRFQTEPPAFQPEPPSFPQEPAPQADIHQPGHQQPMHQPPASQGSGQSVAPPMHQPSMHQPMPPMHQPHPPHLAQEEPATEIVPAPHLQNYPTVLLVLQDGSNRSYQVQEGSNIIGRGVDADLRLPDTGVSRQHAEVTWDGRDAVLVDLQSTNGTTVNNMPVENWLLADGDVIAVGHSYIEVRISG